MSIKLDVFEVEQPIKVFYTTVMDSEVLYEMSKSDILTIPKEHNGETEKIKGNQRDIIPGKINSIVNYLSNEHATFPNSIIVNLNTEYLIDKSQNMLEVQKNKNAFYILDGQHRIVGLHRAKKRMDVIVSIFIGLDDELQRDVFNTINSEQTKVNPSAIVYKEAFSSKKTPQQFSADLSVRFAVKEQSAWHKKIKILGLRDEDTSPEGTLSLKAFERPISDMLYNDRDKYKILQKLRENENNLSMLDMNYDEEKFIFWPFYKEEKIDMLEKILGNYFKAVSDVLPKDFSNQKSILVKTTGYNAIMKLFRDVYLEGKEQYDFSYNFFYEKLEPLSILNGKLLTENGYGGSGDSTAQALYLEFSSIVYKT